MFRTKLIGWLKGKSRAAKPHRLPARKFRPKMETLEGRDLPSLAAPVSYTIGTQPDSFVPNAAPETIATGDFTGNGITDMVVAHTSDDSLYFLRGNGDGTFQAPVKIATLSQPIDGDVFAADFNGDGKLDLFVPTITVKGGAPADSYPIIILGNGDGTFQAPNYSTQDFLPSSLEGKSYVRGWAVGDFNGDGKVDLVANIVAEGVTVMLGNGNGTFQAPIFTPVQMGYSRWMAAGDFNGDGKTDLAIADGTGTNNQTGSSELTILWSNGDGTFRLGGHYAAPPTADPGFDGNGAGDVVNPEDVMVADLNHDGKLDVVESLYDHSIDVFLGNGDGTFQQAVGYTTGEYPRAVAVADINGDGIPDLIVDNVGVGPGGAVNAEEGFVPGTIAVLYGNGDGTFQAPVQYSSVYYPGWTVVGDFNGDGLPDIAVTQVEDANTVNVILNQSATGAATVTSPASADGSLPDQPNTIFTNTVPGTQTTLSVLATDPGTDASPTYTWSVLSKPNGATNPAFSVNNSNAAADTTVTFSQAGLYGFEVTITDPTTGKSITSSTQVSVLLNHAPTVATGASASPSPVNGTQTTLSVLPADDGGSTNLTFRWTATGTPPAPVTFSPTTVIVPTGIGANFVTTATFSKTGAYTLQVTMTDEDGLSTTSSVNVTVNQTLTSIAVSPNSVRVGDNNQQQFTATALDQFGNPMTAQPTFTWSVSGGGTISSTGLFTAGASPGGPFTITATSGGKRGTAQATVTGAVNQAPAITSAASTTFTTGTAGSFTVTVTGSPTPTLSEAGALPSGVSFNTATDVLSGTAATGTGGTYTLTFTATNGVLPNATQTFTLTVTPGSPPPTDTWTGLGTTNNWSDAANWSTDIAPGAGTTVIFSGTSSKNAVDDSIATIAAVQINSGYTGTVSLNRNLTVAGTFSEQAGTYNAGSFATSVSGLTTVSGGTYLASTTSDNLTGGLTVSGGTFTGSTGTVTTGNLTLSSGTLNAPSGMLDVTGGNFTYTGGIFNADEGTVSYGGSGTPAVSAPGLKFYNFQDALAGYPSGMTIEGTLTVTGTFSVLGNSVTINGNIEAQGNVDDENHGGIGNPYLTLDGNANQTIEDLSGLGGGQFRSIVINKSGGTVSLACNPLVFSGLTLTAGTVNTGAFEWQLGSLGPVSATAGLNLGNIGIDGNNVTVSGSSLQVGTVTFEAAGDKFTAPTGNLFVSGNWNNRVGGTFVANGGTVVFDGAGGTIQQVTSGGKVFNSLTISVGAALQLEDNLTIIGIFTNLGTLDLNGHTLSG